MWTFSHSHAYNSVTAKPLFMCLPTRSLLILKSAVHHWCLIAYLSHTHNQKPLRWHHFSAPSPILSQLLCLPRQRHHLRHACLEPRPVTRIKNFHPLPQQPPLFHPLLSLHAILSTLKIFLVFGMLLHMRIYFQKKTTDQIYLVKFPIPHSLLHQFQCLVVTLFDWGEDVRTGSNLSQSVVVIMLAPYQAKHMLVHHLIIIIILRQSPVLHQSQMLRCGIMWNFPMEVVHTILDLQWRKRSLLRLIPIRHTSMMLLIHGFQFPLDSLLHRTILKVGKVRFSGCW